MGISVAGSKALLALVKIPNLGAAHVERRLEQKG